MSFDFDALVDRRESSSTKWERFADDVLPMWIADMDFAAPDFILDAIAERLAHPILGYTNKSPELVEAFIDWLAYHHQWDVPEEWLVWLPGVVPGINLAAQTLQAGSLMVPTPVYYPFLEIGANAGLPDIQVPMMRDKKNDVWHWSMDLERMQRALMPDTKMLMICNPQNPTGRAYSYAELRDLAEFVERNELILVSDEIHCNILLDANAQHVPVARAFPEIAAQTVTLFAATKAYNIPGVSCAVAVIPDADLRHRILQARRGLIPGIGPLGFAASHAAFADRGSWLADLNDYLRGNLQLMRTQLGERLAHLDGTYLAWVDVADLELEDTEAYFAQFGLGVSPGALFGEPSHIRLNFGCARASLEEGLARLQQGIAAR